MLILKVGFVLKLRCQSHHVRVIANRFGDIQNLTNLFWTLSHRQEVCMDPILANDSILNAFKYAIKT